MPYARAIVLCMLAMSTCTCTSILDTQVETARASGALGSPVTRTMRAVRSRATVAKSTRKKKKKNCKDFRFDPFVERQIQEKARALLQKSTPSRYVTFLGSGCSGHSLTGSVVDAAPNALIANEFDAVRKFANGEIKNRDELFQDLAVNSIRCSMYGRFQNFNYSIPGTFQGHLTTTVDIIGDKKGGKTLLSILQSEGNFHKFARMISIPIHIVVVVRNPFDMIACHQNKHEQKNDTRTELRLILHKDLEALRYLLSIIDKPSFSHYNWYVMSSEQFVEDTQTTLASLCAFTGMDCSPDLYDRINNFTHHKAHAVRFERKWEPSDFAEVVDVIARYAQLKERYALDDLPEIDSPSRSHSTREVGG
jgi:hypothetical protein